MNLDAYVQPRWVIRYKDSAGQLVEHYVVKQTTRDQIMRYVRTAEVTDLRVPA